MCFELATKDIKAMLCSVMNFFDLSFMTWINLYVIFISKNWVWFYTFYTLLGFVALVLFAIFAPESPKWLHMQGCTQEAIKVLEHIAQFNGSDK
jgi:hypothetical protein